MSEKKLPIRLTDKDIKTISGNSNICTDSHGNNCNISNRSNSSERLN